MLNYISQSSFSVPKGGYVYEISMQCLTFMKVKWLICLLNLSSIGSLVLVFLS